MIKKCNKKKTLISGNKITHEINNLIIILVMHRHLSVHHIPTTSPPHHHHITITSPLTLAPPYPTMHLSLYLPPLNLYQYHSHKKHTQIFFMTPLPSSFPLFLPASFPPSVPSSIHPCLPPSHTTSPSAACPHLVTSSLTSLSQQQRF